MVSLLWVLLKKEPETRLWVLLASQAGDHSERGTKKKTTRANTTEPYGKMALSATRSPLNHI